VSVLLGPEVETQPLPQVWRPHNGQQIRFLSSPADEALFGGAAGPGKTECLLMESLRQIANPRYRAILFRRTFSMLEAADGLIDRSQRWFPAYGGVYNASTHKWVFPSGARIFFGHMQHADDRFNYQGAQFTFIGFDELTEFEERQYLYLFSRNRAPREAGLRVYMRSATNPGNLGHEWVKARFVTRDIVNRIRYFAMLEDRDTEVEPGHPLARSRTYIPAKMQDNPSLAEDYIKSLEAMQDPVEKARLILGDWDAESLAGRIFDNWSSEENVSADAVYRDDRPLYWAVDDGYARGKGPGYADYHPRVIIFAQDNDIGGVDVIDEDVATEETYETTLDRVLNYEFYPYKRPSAVWMPGEAATFRAYISGKGISSVNGTHRVVEGIKAVRQLVQGGDGARRLRVNPRCTGLIFEMARYRMDPKSRSDVGEFVPLKMNDHSIDALRYLVYAKRGR
jgi:hypothetical protein